VFVRIDDNFVVNTDKICCVDMFPGSVGMAFYVVLWIMGIGEPTNWAFKNEEDAKEFYNRILHQLGVKNENQGTEKDD
jgi:hypothetical protein